MRLAIVASHPIQYQTPLFRELAGRFDVKVFFAYRATPRDQAAAGYGVEFEWDNDLLSGYPFTFVENKSFRPGLKHFFGCDTPSVAAELAQYRPDAVLVLGWNLKSYWQAIWAGKRARIPVLVRGDSQLQTPRTAIKRAVKSFIYPVGLRVFDAALYVGTHSRRYWEHYGYPRQRLFASPHCVDNQWFASRATPDARAALRATYSIPASAKVVLFAGRVVALKRIFDLLAAAELLKKRGINLTIMLAGSGPLENEIAAAAAAIGTRLVQLGFCNQSQMPGAYAAADVLALPSDSETWGLVVNEAIASGTPVVVSDACGCSPDLADGTAGLTYPTGNVESLAAAINQLLKFPPSAAELASVAARHSVRAAADGVEAAMKACLSRGKKNLPA